MPKVRSQVTGLGQAAGLLLALVVMLAVVYIGAKAIGDPDSGFFTQAIATMSIVWTAQWFVGLINSAVLGKEVKR